MVRFRSNSSRHFMQKRRIFSGIGLGSFGGVAVILRSNGAGPLSNME